MTPTTATMPEELRAECGQEPEQTWLLLDSLLPMGQQWFYPKEISELFNVHVKSVGNAFRNSNAARRLLGFGFNFEGKEDYLTKQFPRWAVIFFALKNANFNAPIYRANIDDMTANMTTVMLDYLIKSATTERARRR